VSVILHSKLTVYVLKFEYIKARVLRDITSNISTIGIGCTAVLIIDSLYFVYSLSFCS